jgi:hypothetical protein
MPAARKAASACKSVDYRGWFELQKEMRLPDLIENASPVTVFGAFITAI